jgi:hypothetical protein
MLGQGAKNPSRKPPPATRHRAVTRLYKAVPLYDMRLLSSTSLQAILQSSTNAEKVMMVMTVLTDRIYPVKEDLKYLEMRISFNSPEDPDDDNKLLPKSDVMVIMPQDWTPKMYLAALNKSVSKHSILSLESITIDGRIYATINELEWLFSATHSRLICSASYIRVSGGVLKSI